MILYRYFNLTYGLEALQTGKLKVSRLDKLNDIFDCRPRMINLPSGIPGGDSFPDLFLKGIAGVYGVLCYSATINDPVIWGHYADSHSGLALGFDFDPSDEKSPQIVNYSKERPELDFKTIGTRPQDRNHNEAHGKLIAEGFRTKHPSWKYEQEYREFEDLNQCEMVGVHYFRPLPFDRLRAVVLGAKCAVTMQDMGRIILTAEDKQIAACRGVFARNVQVRQCKADTTSYDLNFVDFYPISRTP
jgi:hypothetical protein